MSADPQRDAWVERVLGIKLAPTTTTSKPRLAPGARLQPVWRDAKETVDAELNILANELRDFDDPDLNRIADLGLYSLGQGENVAMMKALIEYDAASPDKRDAAGKKLKAAVEGYRKILTNPFASLIDTNPLGVKVGLCDTLGQALSDIEGAIA